MTVLLRHVRTGHYYRGNYEWVMMKADARDFGSIEEALDVLARDRLDGMSVVIRYESGPEQVFDLSDSALRMKPLPRE